MLLNYVNASYKVDGALRILTSEYGAERRMFTTDLYACRKSSICAALTTS